MCHRGEVAAAEIPESGMPGCANGERFVPRPIGYCRCVARGLAARGLEGRPGCWLRTR